MDKYFVVKTKVMDRWTAEYAPVPEIEYTDTLKLGGIYFLPKHWKRALIEELCFGYNVRNVSKTVIRAQDMKMAININWITRPRSVCNPRGFCL